MFVKYSVIIGLNLLFIGCQFIEKPAAANIDKDGMVFIPGGTLNMGGDGQQSDADEFPKHSVLISAFWMDETEVTNAQFRVFVTENQYITVAERPIDWEEMRRQLPPNTPKPADSLLLPGSLIFNPPESEVLLNNYSQWWIWKTNANWRNPLGDPNSISGMEQHPVVQVAWEDAQAYCRWAKKRLPTEAEWEWAARGGKNDEHYTWGNELNEDKPQANFWQGLFPVENTLKDGYYFSAPVKSFAPNAYGLFDMAGNVWEWCSDWYDYEFYRKGAAIVANTVGPKKSFHPSAPYIQEKVMRGGSFLCAENYCSGYRNARRMRSSPDTGLNHTGFRCVCEGSG